MHQNSYFKNMLLMMGLVFLTLLLNFQIISFNAMYFEQPLLYAANLHADSLKALLYQYAHPKLLNYAAPFFRPSGHYLMYFIFVPLVGWHNTQAFFIINLLFLALSGWLIVRIYQLLFPNYFAGGLVAYAIYLMHPAMMTSRWTIMHFEYAHVFFALVSLFFFMKFCKQNEGELSLKHFSYFVLSMLAWIVATTFKEVALMLGPVLVCYLLMVYRQENLRAFTARKDIRKIIAILFFVTVGLFFYMTASWYSFLQNPARGPMNAHSSLDAVIGFTKFFFGIFTPGDFQAYHTVVDPIVVLPVMLGLSLLILGMLLLRRFTLDQKKKISFLGCCSLLFIVLPVGWSATMPWHLNLTILFFGLIAGIAVDKFFKSNVTLIIALIIAFITPFTNHKNIQDLNKHYSLAIKVNKNAISHPPLPRASISSDSIILVEDKILGLSYYLGASALPYGAQGAPDMKVIRTTNPVMALPFHPTYNGYLFSYAYLMPSLREEDYEFTIEKMNELPYQILYNWIQNQNHIFCFSYDKNGHWFDETARFKKYLLVEQSKRHMIANPYSSISHRYWRASPSTKMTLPVEDAQLCQYYCDNKIKNCKAFVLLNTHFNKGVKPQCLVYSDVHYEQATCPDCTIYIKTT